MRLSSNITFCSLFLISFWRIDIGEKLYWRLTLFSVELRSQGGESDRQSSGVNVPEFWEEVRKRGGLGRGLSAEVIYIKVFASLPAASLTKL